jgi:oxygen-dependent protoporphyrinogen oxidase
VGYKQQIVVIGAGLSGLACAFRLKKLGLTPLVLERNHRPGGLIASIQKNGFLFESGPQCPRFPAAARRLLRELNLEQEFVAGPLRPKRYILRHGKLFAAPFSPAAMIATRLVGTSAKLRIFADLFGRSSPPDHEETLGEFVRRKFGAELLDHVVDPIVETVFMSDPERMGMESALPAFVEFERNHGSISRGAIRARRRQKKKDSATANHGARNEWPASLNVTDALPSLGSFRSGMQALPARLSQELRECIRYRCEIASIAPAPEEKPGWHLQLGGGEQILTERLVLAVPAFEAAIYLRGSHPQLASRLTAIQYAPACVIGLGYARSQVGHPLDGFGYMVPRKEGLSTICTFWNSSLFPQRAAPGKVIVTSFARSEDGSSGSLEMLADQIEAENSKVLGISGAPLDRMTWTDARAMPQYGVGHARRISEIRSQLASLANLHLIGNYLLGRSIGDCIEVAEKAAQEVVASAANAPGADLPCRC